jgi:hypothetical protein
VTRWSFVVAFAFAACAARSAQAAPPAPAVGDSLKVKTVTLLVGHRVFPDFKDLLTVPPGKEAQVAESEFTAKVTRFVPDFGMDRKGRVVSRTNVPRNPAVQVIVREGGVPKDTVWAFVNFPPHFSRNSMLSFRVVRLDFLNGQPITVVPDTTDAGKKR